jgi:hypothetical protein
MVGCSTLDIALTSSLLITYLENDNTYAFISCKSCKERLIFTEQIGVATMLKDYTCTQKCLVRSSTALPTYVSKWSLIYCTSSEWRLDRMKGMKKEKNKYEEKRREEARK